MNIFATYDQALKLKQLGFDEPCATLIENIPIPIKRQVYKWFREKYNYGYHVRKKDVTQEESGYEFIILNISNNNQLVYKSPNEFNTLDEAEDTCINKLIELIKP